MLIHPKYISGRGGGTQATAVALGKGNWMPRVGMENDLNFLKIIEYFKYAEKYRQEYNRYPCTHHPDFTDVNISVILLRILAF